MPLPVHYHVCFFSLFSPVERIGVDYHKGQSKSAGQKAVEEALRLRKARDTLRNSIKSLEAIIVNGSSEPYEIAEAEMELPDLHEKLEKTQKSLSLKERALGVEGKSRYVHLASSPFLADLMNARALKLRLRQRLQARKFERDRLEGTFRRQVGSKWRFPS